MVLEVRRASAIDVRLYLVTHEKTKRPNMVPNTDSPMRGLAFVSRIERFDKKQVLAHCLQILPDYMVPGRIISHDEMTLNSNGKFDRTKIANLFGGSQA